MGEPLARSRDYSDVIVHKPWGYEYLMYRNEWVALWYLYIRADNQTSMHCHPKKKTGLILLSGEAKESYLNDSVLLKALSKLIIRSGLFHSTAAISPEGVVILEIETPPEKENLVRLDDVYGRKEKPYEGADALSPITKDCVRLQFSEKGQTNNYSMHGCSLSMEFIQDYSQLQSRQADELIVVLEGGLVSKDNDPILSPGDVVTSSTLARLAPSFAMPAGIYFLGIRQEQI